MQIGDRVRYKYLDRQTGTIVGEWPRPDYGDWLVLWDSESGPPRYLPAFEENLEKLEKNLEPAG